MIDTPVQSVHAAARELATTLNEARLALEVYGERPGDTTSLLRVAALAHEVQGVLRVVEIFGGALLAEEVEHVARFLATKPSDGRLEAEGLDALMRAIVQLPTYIERVLGGGRDLALVLLPLLNDLRAVRGNSLLSEGTLLSLNLSSDRRPEPQAAKPGEPALSIGQWARRLRPRFQQALLGWLREDDATPHLQQLTLIAEKFEQLATTQPVFQFWWVVGAVLEGLAHEGLESSATLKRLLGQADREIRRLYESGEARYTESPPIDLLNNLLYYVARATSGGPRVSGVRSSFRLAELLPVDQAVEEERQSLSAPSVKLMKTVAAAIREDLGRVKDALDLFMRKGGQPEELMPQVELLKKIGDTLAVLGLGSLRERVQGELARLTAVAERREASVRDRLVEIAAALITVEDGLDDGLVRLIMPPGAPGIAEEQDPDFRQVAEAVLRECTVNLARVKESIALSLGGTGETAGLDAVPPLIRGITAGLLMLGKTRAVDVMDRIGRHVVQLLAPGRVPAADYVERLADAIVSLEYYMETLQAGRSDPWYMLDNAERCLASLDTGTVSPHAALPDVPAAAAATDATLVIDGAAIASAHAAGIAPPAADAAPPAPTPAVPAPIVPREILPPVGAHAAPNNEFLEVFIEEAREEIAIIQRFLPMWDDNASDRESLTRVRRAFHTLKGSGRMVGATRLGEFAWSIENLLNRLLDGTRERTPAVLTTLRRASAVTAALIGELDGGAATAADAEVVAASAQALAEGREAAAMTMELPVIPSPAAPVAEATQVMRALDPDAMKRMLEQVPPLADALAAAATAVRAAPVVIDAEPATPEAAAVEPAADAVVPATELPGAPVIELGAGDDETPEELAETSVPESSLVDIYRHEVEGHLETIRAFLRHAWISPGPHLVTEDLYRACHTLRGASRSAENPDGIELAEPLHRWMRRLFDHDRGLNEAGLNAIADAVALFEDVVTKPRAAPVDEIRSLRDRLVRLDAELERELASGVAAGQVKPSPVFDPTATAVNPERPAVSTPPAAVPVAAAAPVTDFDPFAAAAATDFDPFGEAEAAVAAAAPATPVMSPSSPAPLRDYTDTGAVERVVLTGDETESLGTEAVETVVLEGNTVAAALAAEDIESVEVSTVQVGDVDSGSVDLDMGAGAPVPEIELTGAEQAALDVSTESIFEDVVVEDRNEQSNPSIDLELPPPELGPGEQDVPFIDTVLEASFAPEIDTSLLPKLDMDRSGTSEQWVAQLLEAGVPPDGAAPPAVTAPVEAAAAPIEAPADDAGHEPWSSFGPGVVLEVEGPLPGELLGDGVDEIDDITDQDVTRTSDEAVAPPMEAAANDAPAAAEPVAAEPVAAAAVTLAAPPTVDAVTDSDDAGDDDASFDPEIAAIFGEEATELLETADVSLAAMRMDAGSRAPLAELLRALHTLKGGARMAGIRAMGDLSHEVESLLTLVTANEVSADARVYEALQGSLDELARMRDQVSAGGKVKPARDLITRLRRLGRGETVAETQAAPVTPPTPVHVAAQPVVPSATVEVEDTSPPAQVVEAPAAVDEPVAEAAVEQPAPPEAAADVPPEQAATPAPVPEARDTPAVLPGREAAAERGEMARVDADLLDSLLNNAGEVSIYRARLDQQLNSIEFNLGELGRVVQRLKDQLRKLEMETEAQILHRHVDQQPRRSDFDPLELDRYSALQQYSRGLAETAADVGSVQNVLESLTRDAQNFLMQQGRVVGDLQNGLMRTRMVPFQRHSQRLTRIVRQAAADTGKKAELTVDGASGELDRQVLDRMLPPFEHLLRNAVVHGIESPEQRRASGKDETGRLTITLKREGAEVVIVVTDDGAGINLQAVREKAIALGFIEPKQQLSDEEALQLIFEPGFSTAGRITQAAGRGVGMDVVATEVKKLGGALFTETRPGRGTTFTIRLPFTLAIGQALIVRCGDELFALPLPTVEGVVRMPVSDVRRHLESDAPSFDYGNQRYRFQHLGSFVGAPLSTLPEADVSVPVILVRAGDHSTAILTDELLGSREIVVKSVGPQISGIRGISGATILGDGRICIILDIGALVRSEWRARPSLDSRDRGDTRAFALVVDDSITVRRVTQRLLERNGMRVLTARDGLDAIAVMQEHVPDVILLDIEMPRMDGYEVASQVRNDPRLKDIPIVMITSRVGEKHRARAIELGVEDYLGKPYQEAQLLEAIEPLLQRRRGGVA